MAGHDTGPANVTSEEKVRQIVRETVRETLTSIGINVIDSDAAIEVQKDQAWLRKARVNYDEFGKKAKLAMIGSGGTLAAWALWEGNKAAWRVKGGG